MNKKLNTPTEERQMQEDETNEMILAEDAVQTTAYLATVSYTHLDVYKRQVYVQCAEGLYRWI